MSSSLQYDFSLQFNGSTGIGKNYCTLNLLAEVEVDYDHEKFIEIAGGTRGIVNHQNTTDISAFKVSVSNFRDSNIVLVDVPTFNDTDKPDIEILQTISDWLNQT